MGHIGDLLGRSQTFNGGIIINGEWYQSVEYPLPIIPDNFVIYCVSSWGYRIVGKVKQ